MAIKKYLFSLYNQEYHVTTYYRDAKSDFAHVLLTHETETLEKWIIIKFDTENTIISMFKILEPIDTTT